MIMIAGIHMVSNLHIAFMFYEKWNIMLITYVCMIETTIFRLSYNLHVIIMLFGADVLTIKMKLQKPS